MDTATRTLIEALHQAPVQYVLALTGGGTTTAGLLLAVPGGSRTILEVVVPYNERALHDFLGAVPAQHCSVATAQALARRAWERAAWLAPRQAVAGVSCTATLATDRPKRGDHRFHIAVHTQQRTSTHSLVLNKGARDREGEEAVLTAVLLNALAEACDVNARLPVPLLPGETLPEETAGSGDPLAALLRGELPRLCVTTTGRFHADAGKPSALLPGSFNPVHQGHRALAAVAAQLTGQPVAFELSVGNVDKPALPAEEVRHRLAQFAWQAPVWLTQAPTFLQKAELFPGTLFVVGADTAVRIVEPLYYQNSEEHMRQALDRIRTLGCRFLVGGRVDRTGAFQGVDDLGLPAAYRDLFTGIPESGFRQDISSTQLRG